MLKFMLRRAHYNKILLFWSGRALGTMYAVTVFFLSFSYSAGWSTPIVTCPTACPLQTVQYTCKLGNTTQGLQWLLWNITTNDLLAPALAPTNKQSASECLEGVLFLAEKNKTSLMLSFIAKPLTEHIRISCCNPNLDCADCNVKITSPPSYSNLSSTTLPNSSVLLSWFPPSDDPLCVEYYVVNVTPEYNTKVVTTNSTSLLLGPLEPGWYEFSVAGVDALNRTGEYSKVSTSIGSKTSSSSALAVSLLPSLIPTSSKTPISQSTTPVEVITGGTIATVVLACIVVLSLLFALSKKKRKQGASKVKTPNQMSALIKDTPQQQNLVSLVTDVHTLGYLDPVDAVNAKEEYKWRKTKKDASGSAREKHPESDTQVSSLYAEVSTAPSLIVNITDTPNYSDVFGILQDHQYDRLQHNLGPAISSQGSCENSVYNLTTCPNALEMNECPPPIPRPPSFANDTEYIEQLGKQ